MRTRFSVMNRQFMQWRKSHPAPPGKEWHHLIPLHAGGTNDPGNIVAVTRKEHILHHWDRWKQYGESFDIWGVAKLLGKHWRCYQDLGFDSQFISEVREACSYATQSHRNPNFGKTTPSDVRNKISQSLRGKSPSLETREKLRQAFLGDKSCNAKAFVVKNEYLNIPDTYISSLSPFCRTYRLNIGCMSQVAGGYRSTHKGWQCRYATEEDRKNLLT